MSPLSVTGPSLTLRYAVAEDAARMLELASDPEVTRWFSWGPYTSIEQPLAYIDSLEDKRESGVLLDFAVEHREHGVVGVTGLSELAARDGRATVGTWFGREYWGSGINLESKQLMYALAFEHLGLNRLTSWANTRNGRSQRALERAGFRREGVMRGWHRHGDTVHDVVCFGLLRADWEPRIEARVEGRPPGAWICGAAAAASASPS